MISLHNALFMAALGFMAGATFGVVMASVSRRKPRAKQDEQPGQCTPRQALRLVKGRKG